MAQNKTKQDKIKRHKSTSGVDETAQHNGGSLDKSSNYRSQIKKHVKGIPTHPIHAGIYMEAHHLISGDAAKPFKEKIEPYGYDINWLSNLSYIPGTFQGACHLGVQPHIGNHDVNALVDAPDVDADRLKSYHVTVEESVRDIVRKMQRGKKCASHQLDRVLMREHLDELSNEIAKDLCDDPPTLYLTKATLLFSPQNKIGCGGQQEDRHLAGSKQAPVKFANYINNELKAGRDCSCPKHRDHYGDGKISYKKPNEPYKLIPGQ